MRRDDLKPCPFCGSGRVTVWNIRDGQQAVCKECKSTGAPTFHGLDGPKATWGHAVEAWNRREPETDEERCCRVLETIAPPDNGSVQEVLSAALQCANAWVPEARILGNVRAGDLSRAISSALSIEQTQPVAEYEIGAQVEKFTGDYQIPGEVRTAFTMKNGAVRYVVEHEAAGGGSFCHIYSGKNIRPALVNAQADVDVVERWQPIDTAPRDGVRVILMWEPFGGVSEHVELGKWSIHNGWVNTYGHAFTGSPTHWMPVPPPSTTRIADSADAGCSATLSSDADEACPGEHQEVLDAIQSHNSGEDE